MTILLNRLADSIAAPLRWQPSKWADERFYLSPEDSAEYGKYRLSRAPYQQGLLDAIADPEINQVVIMSSAQVGKALDINTPIRTINGWKRMESICVGDIVFDETGQPCNVIGVSEIQHQRDCYAVTFSDGSVIVADADHLWTVEESRWGEIGNFTTLTTKEMLLDFKRVKRNGKIRNRYGIPVSSPLSLDRQDLLIPPYLLGVWLGDGHTKGSRISCHKDDAGHYKSAFLENGYKVDIKADKGNTVRMDIDPKGLRDTCVRGHQLLGKGVCPSCAKVWYTNSNRRRAGKLPTLKQDTVSVFGLQLIELGVKGNKFIPWQYLNASYEQRLDLLCGLMDTDGYVGPNGRCEFLTTCPALAKGVKELLAGLGIKFTVAQKQPTTVYKGEKVNGKMAFRFSFMVYDDKPIFKLPRKLQLMASRDGRRTTETERRKIIDISPVESRPVKCIAVDSPSHLYLAGESLIPTHNTTLLKIIFGYFVDIDPSPMLWVCPTLQEAERTSKTRLDPMIRDCPNLKPKFGTNRARGSVNNTLLKVFPGGLLVLSGANSPASLSSYPIRIVVFDEVDRYDDSAGEEGDPIALAKVRTTTFPWNKVLIYVSTPALKDSSRIEKLWDISDKRLYHVPCPHCGYEQELIWDNLNYPGKGEINIRAGIERIPDVTYGCVNCGGAIAENQKPEMIRRGRWVSTAKSAGIAGFHLESLISPWKRWEDIALDYETAKDDPLQLQVWHNTARGLPFERDDSIKYDWQTLLVRAEKSDYSMGSVPEGALFLTAGVDVQGNRLECAVFGWGEGEECWLIDYQIFMGEPIEDEPWQALADFLEKDYPHPLGGVIRVKMTCVDTGYLDQECYRQILKRRNWRAIKGKDGDRALVSAPSLQDVNYRGKKLKNGIRLYTIGVDSGKAILLNRAKLEREGPKYLHVPQDITQFWAEGFAGSEVQIQKHRNGRPYLAWEQVSGVRNEPLDTAVYAYAAASLAGVTRQSNWAKIRKSLTVETVKIEEEIVTIPDETKPTVEVKPRRVRRAISEDNFANNY